MTAQDMQILTYQVLGGIFLLSFALGWISQRTHFCTMGSIADVYLMGDWTRARQWMTAIAWAVLGYGVLCVGGWVDPSKSLYFSTKWYWASTSLGGALFGAGMVLGSGCGLKTLVRAGSGNLKSWVVFFVMASFAFMTLKGVFAVARVASVDHLFVQFPQGAHLGPLMGLMSAELSGYLGIALGLIGFIWIASHSAARSAQVLLTGLLVGLIVCAVWWVNAHLGYVAEDPETLGEVFLASKSNKAEALSFVGPAAYFLNWLEFFSDQSNVLSTGVVSVMGVFVGSLSSALLGGSFKWEGFTKTDDLVSHLMGAALMGVGGVTAMGCSVGQSISGLSTLSLNAVSTTVFIVLGAWFCLDWQSRRFE